MPDREKPERPPSEEAMNAVLRAEQEALSAVGNCEREAAAIIHAARQRARTIAERTHRRIGALHARCARVTAAQIETTTSSCRAGSRPGSWSARAMS